MIHMGLMEKLMHFGGKLVIEAPAARKTFDELQRELTENRTLVISRAHAVGDTDQHRKSLNHIIGIERWGQSRLKVFLGAPFKQEEYDSYRPSRDASYADLLRQFEETRQATLNLAVEVATEQIDPAARSPHNMFGWLFYLSFHANAESMRGLR
jgi:hypothetical protein